MFKIFAKDNLEEIESEIEKTESMIVLRQLQQKIMGSPALNGGFEKLMFKVDSIEKSQIQIETKIDSIHDAMYKPDNGLFARVAKVESLKEKIDGYERLENKFALFEQQFEHSEQELQKDASKFATSDAIVQTHQDRLKDLEDFKRKFCVYSKWFIVTTLGTIFTLVGKLAYDFITNHITFN